MKFITLLIISILLSACTNTPFKKSDRRISATQQQLAHAQSNYATPPQAVVMHQGYYVSTRPYSIQNEPKWMQKKLSLQAHNLPLGILITRILESSNFSASYDETVNPQRLISIDYTGDVAGALARIAVISNTHYAIANHDVAWSSLVTRTFNISFMPGASNYMVGQSQMHNKDHNQQQDGQVNHLDDMQYSNLSGQLSIWHDLKETLDQLKSTDGKVVVSESTTSVTVKDHPDNVSQMAHYIARLNKALSQEVGIRVEVIEVALNDDYNFGIDWNVIKNVLNTKVSLTGNLSTATNLIATNLTNRSNNTGLAGFRIGNSGSDNSHFLLNALEEEGKVRVVTKPQVVTMNNQIASIRITQDTGYIRSISSSQFNQYQTTTITPGTITDGFTLYVLPKIQDDKVYMQISSRIANLMSLQKVSNEPANVEHGTVASNSQFSAIEVPTIASKEFNQRSVVQSGSTLIIAGYKRLRDHTLDAKMFGVSSLGGQGSQSKNVETLMLITPVILKSATA